MEDCRPLGFLIGLSFALLSLILSLVGTIFWIIGSLLACLFLCCVCCTGIADLAVSLVKLPVKIIQWCIDRIPCYQEFG